uniref:Lipocalin n=1 Tax=Rhipicephalus appendiculatus TaxID=34631 RepID=A0A131YS01_RHIAP
MPSLALVVCMLFAASSVTRGDPDAYAESEEHFNEQKLSALTNVSSTLFIKRRNYRTASQFRCHYAKKVQKNEDGTLTYELGARLKGQTQYEKFEVRLTPRRTGNHTDDNAATYQESKGEGPVTHRIVTMNNKHDCFVVTLPYNSSNVCFILMTAETANGDIPEHCNMVYKENCEESASVDLYQSDCQQQQQCTSTSHI